ncbi:MAG: cytochrome c biogenesis protein CcsA [Bacteroidales bacterium]|nr:cytochrome c biogenesis protein CcsA [Bacteroidales bacterium]
MNINSLKSLLLSLISDIRFALISLLLSIIFIATATFVEKFYGTEIALNFFYYNVALYLLFTISAISFIAFAIKFKLAQRGRYGAIVLHFAFIIIIIGAITTHYTGKEGNIHLREGDVASYFTSKDGDKINLPFSIKLNRFEVEYYEGNEFPLAYKSFVTIDKKECSYDAIISVNKILREKGYRIYQLSYDEDMKGSTLLVNRDFEGTLITYIGYGLLLVGFLLSLFGKSGRIKDILASISSKGGKASIIVILLLSSIHANANELVIEEQNLIPYEDAKKWENVIVLSNNGILEPLECHARTILRKITHSNGNDNDMWGARLYMSFISNPEVWCNTPIIYCSDKNIVKLFSNDEGKYISFNSLFDSEGRYKLNSLGNNKVNSKELLKLDEKARIFSALLNCSLLKIFPTDEGKWVSPNENNFKGNDSLFVATAINSYISGNIKDSNEIIDHIATFQEIKYKGDLPSSTKRKLSIIYSKVPIFKIVAFGYIILGALLLFMAIKYSSTSTFMQQIKMGATAGAIFAIFLLHTSGIILRWYVSSQPPWSNTYETMLYIAWCIALGGLLFMKRTSIILALSAVMAAVTLLISSLNWLDPVITPLMPVLNSPWLILHVTVITASYGFFAICAVIGLYSLIVSFKRDSDKIIKELSSINEFFMYIGLILVTVGTFLGAIWANLSWGRYWGWDAKESWALITIFVYAIVTHTRLVPKLKNDIIFSGLSIFATLSVLMTYFGVNYYLSGLHSYGNNSNIPSVDIIIYAYLAIVLISVFAFLKNRQRNRCRTQLKP